MASESSKITKKDLLLLRLSDYEKRYNRISLERPKIYIGINRKYIGMTKKERDAALDVSKRN